MFPPNFIHIHVVSLKTFTIVFISVYFLLQKNRNKLKSQIWERKKKQRKKSVFQFTEKSQTLYSNP